VSKFRILSIFVAVGLLVGAFGISSVLAKQVDRSSLDTLDASYAPAAVAIADANVEWTLANGDAASYVTPTSSAIFYINDDALESTIAGNTAIWSGATPATDGSTSQTFVIGSGAVIGATGVATFALTAPSYASTTPASTPLASLTVDVDGFTESAASNSTTGAYRVIGGTAVNATVTATFSHHIADSWDGQDSTLRRAKVISTSDPQGEYVTVAEVTAIGTTVSSPTSQIFRGSVQLTSDALYAGTANDGIWVQDGDTLTVNYLDSTGATVDSDTVTVDGVKPTVSAVTPADGTVTNIDNPTVQFEVTDLGSGITATNPASAISITINGIAVPDGSASFQAIASGFRVIFASGNSWIGSGTGGFGVAESTPFTWQITATDVAGNIKVLETTDLDLTIDQSTPGVLSAVTGTGWDVDTALETTGVTNAVKLVMNEIIDSSSVTAADITVAGVQAASVLVGTTTGHKANIYITTSTTLAPDAKPDVVVAGEILDLAGNAVDTTLAAEDTVTAADALKPAATITVDKALAILADVVKVTVSSDEKLTSAGGLVVAILGPAASTGNGLLTTTAPTPLTNEGSETVTATVVTGAYGVSVKSTDMGGGNSTNNLTAVAAETLASTAISTDGLTLTLAKGPIGDANFDGALTVADIGITDATVDISANVTTIDASARTVKLSTAVAGTVIVSYSYVGTDVFEVDQTAPTVTFDPIAAATVENQSPFIRVIFDEDEYPGDSYTGVTLTAASLKGPSATTDVLANFVVEADGFTYIWAATDLALGDYTLTVSGKDTAGNVKADQATTFTIAARAKYSVALRPGWNLISLPGEPASSAIGDVIDNLKVDTVLTYDPLTAGGWLTATRGADGWVGNLDTITGSRAYWVRTTTFDAIKVDIPALSAGAPVLPPAHQVSVGWNLLPVSVLDLTTTSTNAKNYFSSISWSRAYTFNTQTNLFVGTTPTDTTDTVTVGKGYLVYVTAVGTLVP
jgi:hypothetical protein